MADSSGRFPPGKSGNPKGRPRKVRTDAAAPVTREDGWESLINGLGRSDYDKRISTTFGTVCPVTAETAANLWRGNALAAKAIEKYPAHEARAGFTLTIQDQEDDGEDSEDDDVPVPKARRTDADPPTAQPLPMELDPDVEAAKKENSKKRLERRRAADETAKRIEAVYDLWRKHEVIQKLTLARMYARAYGGAGLLLGAIDNGKMDTPLKEERIREIRSITVLDPREFQPLYYYGDPLHPKFKQVECWTVTPIIPGQTREGKYLQPIEVHETRLVYLQGKKVSETQVTGSTPGHYDSVLTAIYEVLRDFGIGWSAAAILLADFSQAVYKMNGLARLLSADTADDFVERMRNMERARSVARVTLIDKDDEFERKATPMAGLAEVLREFKECVAAAMDMPVTEVFGSSASGLNATGEGDRKSWNASVAASRKDNFLPPLRRVTEIFLAATGGVPEAWDVEGNEIEQLTDLERAQKDKTEAEADHIRIDDGVVSAEEVAVSRYGHGKGTLQIDFEARDNLEAAAAKPVATEGKDPDLEPPPVPMGPDGLPMQPKPDKPVPKKP